MIRFILVHGTFAKSADWPSLSSALMKLSHELGEDASFESILWTGKNSISARQQAEGDILDKINGILSEAQGEYAGLGENKIIVIAHSHGGSAVAYFMKRFPSYAKMVAGYIFLSTPFIAIRPRLNVTQLMGVLMFFPVATACGVIQETIAPNVYFVDMVLQLSWQLTWLQSFALLLPLLIGGLLVGLTYRAEKKVDILVHGQTVDLPPANALFLRFSGDEAAAALSTVQFLSWAAAKLSNLLELLVYPPIVSARWLRKWIGATLGPLFVVSTYQMAVTILPYMREHGIVETINTLLKAHLAGGDVVGIAKIFVVFITVLISPMLLIFLAIVVSVFASLALVLKGFGWAGFFEGFAVELAVEPVPRGSHLLVNLDWSLRENSSDGLVHSWGYSHPAAITEVERFVRRAVRVTTPPM
jgi:hypothetical protein